MKILMVNTEFNRGGAAQIARTLFQSLNKRNGLECYFAYGRGVKPNENRKFKFAYLPEIYLHAFLTWATRLQGYGTCLSTKRLIKFTIREKIDLIRLH